MWLSYSEINLTIHKLLKLGFQISLINLNRSEKGLYLNNFLKSLEEQSSRSSTSFTQKEKYSLMKYLDIDNDNLIKKDFLLCELQKVFKILEEGKVNAQNLLAKEEHKYQSHFEVLKRGMSLESQNNEISKQILTLLRKKMINSREFFDSLGYFLLEEHEENQIHLQSRSVFISEEQFKKFWQKKWQHKINQTELKNLVVSLQACKSHSVENLEDGLFDLKSKNMINVKELTNRMEVTLRFKHESQLAGLRTCIFILCLNKMGLRARQYFVDEGVRNLDKRVELNKFHFICSAHLNFCLDDSDAEFKKLDKQFYGKVRMKDFLDKIEETKRKFFNSENFENDDRMLVENKRILNDNLRINRPSHSNSKVSKRGKKFV